MGACVHVFKMVHSIAKKLALAKCAIFFAASFDFIHEKKKTSSMRYQFGAASWKNLQITESDSFALYS